MAGDEAAANAVLALKDAKFADAASVRGRLVLCPQGTSAHYTLVQWLRSLGLTEKDVKIRFMPPEQALGAFRGGLGDLLVTWAPYTYAAEKEGCALVAQPPTSRPPCRWCCWPTDSSPRKTRSWCGAS